MNSVLGKPSSRNYLALRSTRQRNWTPYFTSDCRRIADDPAEVDTLIEQEKHPALDFLANTYKDIMDNFDPTVVKLRRKRKIILANEKLKDLL